MRFFGFPHDTTLDEDLVRCISMVLSDKTQHRIETGMPEEQPV